MLLTDALLSIIDSRAHAPSSFRDITVITGKGINTKDPSGPVLKENVPKFLREVAGLETTIVEGNEGRFLISGKSLQEWASSEKFEKFLSLL